MLVQGHPIFPESPCPVNDLRPGFNLHLLLLAWDLVGKDLNIDWRTPLPLAILLPFFCMDDIVMNDPLHFALVALCCVSVQNDAFVQKPLFWPTATTRPCGWRLGLERGLGHFGVQPMEHQGLWTTSLHNATPLFTNNRCVWVRGELAQILLLWKVVSSASAFACSKVDLLLFFLHPPHAQITQPLVHVLNGFVVGEGPDGE